VQVFSICENSHKSFTRSIKSGLALEILMMKHHLSVVSLHFFECKDPEQALIQGLECLCERAFGATLQGECGALVTVTTVIPAGLH
jgi:hypothetical protein